jgi:hypothetical protein
MRTRGKSTVTIYFMKHDGADIYDDKNIIEQLNWGFDKPIPRIGEQIHFHFATNDIDVDAEYCGEVYRVDYDYVNEIDSILDVSVFAG